MNIQVTFIERSLNVRHESIRECLACVATIASVNTFRLANVRERELRERLPDIREHRLNVSQTHVFQTFANAYFLLT